MAESSNMQPLATVSSEVDESQRILTLVSISIKAQQELTHKLRKEAARRRETCNFIRQSNLQLEDEIRCAEESLKSMSAAYETIKFANVQLKTECLLSKQSNLELVERIKNGEKKYEELWLQSKERYESLPFVQTLLQITKTAESLKDKNNDLDNEAIILHNDINIKKGVLREWDKQQIVKLAEFLVQERPANLNIIKEKSAEIAKLAKGIEMIKAQEVKSEKLSFECSSIAKPNLQPLGDGSKTSKVVDTWSDLDMNKDETGMMMPKLQFSNAEVEVLSVKLELNKLDYIQPSPVKRTGYVTEFETSIAKWYKAEATLNNDYISSYFPVHVTVRDEDNTKKGESYEKRKLINILSDIRLNNIEAYDIVGKINPVQLQEVNTISANVSKIVDSTDVDVNKKKAGTPLETEKIEEIDITNTNSQNILGPPIEFIDLTQENILRSSCSKQDTEVIIHVSMDETPAPSRHDPSSQEKNSQEITKKRVSFDLPVSEQEVTDNITQDIEYSENNITNDTDKTNNSAFEEELPSVTDVNYMMIKDMILKKHNLDSSPQFVYAKNPVFQKKNEDDKIVTSKFFDCTKQSYEINQAATKAANEEVKAKITEEDNDPKENIQPTEDQSKEVVAMDIDKAVANPKDQEDTRPVTGLLFSHGPSGIPDSLDVSSCTTAGVEDGDGDFAHCLGIDSSLLLSPKADLQPDDNGNNGGEGSQEVTNFLTGFRKTGLFFFGQTPPTAANPDSSATQQNQENNFNFNFTGTDKKSKGGLFSFFR